MRFIYRLILLSAGAVLISALATLVFAFYLVDPARNTQELERLDAYIGESLAVLQRNGADVSIPAGAFDAEREALADTISRAARELAKLRSLHQSELVAGLRGAIGFFALQTILLASVLAAVGVFVSQGLSRLRYGIAEAKGSGSAYRFKVAGAPDFREIADELNRMLALIEAQAAELREAAALMGWREVASFLGHQLKNPLAAISLAAANAREAINRTGINETLKERILGECALVAGDEAARLSALLARFRALTRFDEPAFADVDLVCLLRSALQRAGPSRVDGSVEGPEALILRADAELLSQAFANVIDNSIEAAGGANASPPPSGPVSLRVRIGADGDLAFVDFIDSNTGIDPALAKRLGRERVTTKETGSGLGLLFVRRIAAIHGGDLRVEMTESGGLRLILSLRKEARS